MRLHLSFLDLRAWATGVLFKSIQGINWENSKHLHVWCQSGLQNSTLSFIFVDCNKLTSPGLVPLPAGSFPQKVWLSHGIFNIFESPRQFQCYSFLFQCLGSTHNLLGLFKGLVSHIQGLCRSLINLPYLTVTLLVATNDRSQAELLHQFRRAGPSHVASSPSTSVCT